MSRARSRRSRTKLLPVPKKGALGKFGYHNIKHMEEKKRHTVLNKAIKREGYRKVIGHLTLVANYTYRSDPATHAILKRDQEWVSGLYKIYKTRHNLKTMVRSRSKRK
jgi:hypothetical protein